MVSLCLGPFSELRITKVEKFWCVSWTGILIIPRRRGTAVPEVEFLVRSPLPEGRCMSPGYCLKQGRPCQAWSSLWSSTAQIPLCLLRRQILPSTKLCCLELAPSLWELKATLNSPFFLSAAENWGGSQLGGSHIEKLGGAWGTLRPWSGIQT